MSRGVGFVEICYIERNTTNVFCQSLGNVLKLKNKNTQFENRVAKLAGPVEPTVQKVFKVFWPSVNFLVSIGVNEN